MKIAIYSRKSKFTGKGESIENQIQLCKEYAEKCMTVESINIYEDEGFSGSNINRPEFQKLLSDARKKKFDVLICYRLDRISRNVSDFSTLIDELQSLGVSFISIREQFDTSTPMGRAMMYIASVFAQLERETIAERIRDNMLELAKTGRWLGGQTPFGFESKQISYFDSEMNERKMFKLSPIQNELETVKIVYNKYIESRSIRHTLKYLFTHQYKSKLGADFDTTKVLRILKNPLYAMADNHVKEYLQSLGMDFAGEPDGKHGVMTYNKTKNIYIKRTTDEWIAAVGKHDGIIPAELWITVQSVLEENKATAPRTATSSSALLSGIIKCSKCGKSMKVSYGHVNKESGERYKYYICDTKDLSYGKRCNNQNVRAEEIEKIVINKLKELTSDKSKAIEKIKEYTKSINTSDSSIAIPIDSLEKNIKEKEKQIENLVVQLSQDQSVTKYIIPQIQKLSSEVDALRASLDDLHKTSDKNKSESDNLNILMNLLGKFNTLFDTADFNGKKFIISALVDSVYWNGDTGEVQMNLWGTATKKK